MFFSIEDLKKGHLPIKDLGPKKVFRKSSIPCRPIEGLLSKDNLDVGLCPKKDFQSSSSIGILRYPTEDF